MANISTRASVLAIVPEVTEGTPVEPTAGTQFIARQDDFSIAPNFETVENPEMQASIGPTKPIQGNASPAGSMSHLMRASGTAGVSPGYKEFLKTMFTEVVASTEYDTVASSTVSLIKVNTGEGVQFQRGQPLLIKDPVNGFRVRCLDSVSGDDLSLGFHLPVAPGTGVNLGKSVLFKPKETGHGTFSLFDYLGNGGALNIVTGLRVTGMNISADAGAVVNANYSFEGLDFANNGIIIGTARYIDWTDDDGTHAAAITAGLYHDPHEVAEALTVAMNAANGDETVTVTYSDTTGKFKIVSTGTVLSLLWNTGTNTANTIGTKLGFLVAADDSGTSATTGYTADNAQSYVAPYTPDYDDNSNPVIMKNQEVMVGDGTDFTCLDAATISTNISQEKSDIPSVCAASGKSGSVITGRSTEIQVSGVISQYDSKHFKNFRKNATIKFQMTYGEKSGGNWVAGKVGVIYSPSATITAWEPSNENGTAFISLTLRPFVDDGKGEIFLGYV